MSQVQQTYLAEYTKKIRVFYIVILIEFILLLVVIYLYAVNIVRPIRQLSDVADKISMGDLKTAVPTNATGEIGALAESIDRMQTSVKSAIERLQKR